MKKLKLNVLEAYTRDVGSNKCRIDYKTMKKLKISTGDIIEITGKKKTIATCLPLYPSDENKGIIRIDGLGRKNANIKIGDAVTLRSTSDVPIATGLTVVPVEEIPPLDPRYIADALEDMAVMKDMHIMIPYFGGKLTFVVADVSPKDRGIVSRKTPVQIGKKLISKEYKKIEKKIETYEATLIKELEKKILEGDLDSIIQTYGEINAKMITLDTVRRLLNSYYNDYPEKNNNTLFNAMKRYLKSKKEDKS